jgi:hypothetical protein
MENQNKEITIKPQAFNFENLPTIINGTVSSEKINVQGSNPARNSIANFANRIMSSFLPNFGNIDYSIENDDVEEGMDW